VPNDQSKSARHRRTVADLALTYTAIGVELSECAASLGRTSGDERRSRFLAISHQLGLLGDQCHETRRALHDLALEGAADGSDQNELTTTGELDDWRVLHPIPEPTRDPLWVRAAKRLFNLE